MILCIMYSNTGKKRGSGFTMLLHCLFCCSPVAISLEIKVIENLEISFPEKTNILFLKVCQKNSPNIS